MRDSLRVAPLALVLLA